MNSISPRLFWQLLKTKQVELDVSMLRFTKRGTLELNASQYARCNTCENLLIEEDNLILLTSQIEAITCHTCELDDVMLVNQDRMTPISKRDLPEWLI